MRLPDIPPWELRYELATLLLNHAAGLGAPVEEVEEPPLPHVDFAPHPRCAARIAARHPLFNAKGLGLDIPGTGDWPSILKVGPSGRQLNEHALMTFFGLTSELAWALLLEEPSATLVDKLRPTLERQPPLPS